MYPLIKILIGQGAGPTEEGDDGKSGECGCRI